MDLTKYAALSFDCYGTLIDWEAGMLGVLRPWTTECGLEVDDDRLLAAYGRPRVCGRTRAAVVRCIRRSWPRRFAARDARSVLRSTRRGRHGLVTRCRIGPRSRTPARRSPRWPSSYQLIIVSNVHRAGFAASN